MPFLDASHTQRYRATHPSVEQAVHSTFPFHMYHSAFLALPFTTTDPIFDFDDISTISLVMYKSCNYITYLLEIVYGKADISVKANFKQAKRYDVFARFLGGPNGGLFWLAKARNASAIR